MINSTGPPFQSERTHSAKGDDCDKCENVSRLSHFNAAIHFNEITSLELDQIGLDNAERFFPSELRSQPTVTPNIHSV